jgi:hypothetical protein
VADAGVAAGGNEAGIALLPEKHSDFSLQAAIEPPRASSMARRVELVDSGREPRRALRHRFARGRQKLMVRTLTRFQQQQSILFELKVEAPFDVVLEPKAPPDRATFSYKLGPVKQIARGDDSIRARPEVGGLPEGSTIAGQGTLNERGIVTEHRFDPPADETEAKAAFARSLIAAIIELPEEPVGKGARWDVVLEADSSGIRLTQRTSHEILELRGTTMQIRVKQSESVVVDGGSVPPDLAAAPTEGEWTVRLGHGYPTGRQRVEQPFQAGVELSVSSELSIETRAR